MIIYYLITPYTLLMLPSNILIVSIHSEFDLFVIFEYKVFNSMSIKELYSTYIFNHYGVKNQV